MTTTATNSSAISGVRQNGTAGQFGALAERLPPQSLEAEMSLLGSMMLDREAVGDVIPIIPRTQKHWFYRPDHQAIFEALVDLYDRNEPIDLLIVKNEFERLGILERVGGVDYVLACAESVPTSVHARHYARIVRDKGVLRDLIGCTSRIAELAYLDADNASDILDKAENELYKVTQQRISSQAVPIGELIEAISRQIENDEQGRFTGLPSGFHELDELTSGFQPGDLIIIAGRPSMGKTAFALNVAEYMAVDEGFPIAFFSLEMSKEQVANRLICSRQEIDAHKFRRRMLNEEERERVSFSCGQFQEVPLFIDDTPSMTLLELRTKARRMEQQKKIKAVFVDYLQLMRSPGSESRQQEISTISGGLKALGRQLNVPVIALAQLNRMAEGREGHRPRMSDLRESGAIEQDADVILLLHREEYYKKDDASVRNLAEVIVAKQRNGPTADITLNFNRQFTRFRNFSPVAPPDYLPPGSGASPF